MLAPPTTDQEQIAGLIDDVYAADTVLGEAVSFLLLHPDVHSPLGLHTGMGAFDTLQGMYFPPGRVGGATVRALQHEPLFRDMSTETGIYRAEIARESARTMARFVAEFMEIFEVSEHQLPALCVVVRGLGRGDSRLLILDVEQG